MWDVEYWDDDRKIGYRIRARALRVRDAVAVDSEQDAFSNNRQDVQGREFLILLDLPLLKHGTAVCERASLGDFTSESALDPVFPEDAIWHSFDLDETVFLNLPETLFWSWYAAVITRNPHRDRRYDLLKKRLNQELPAVKNDPNTNANGTGESVPATTSHAS